MVITSKFPGTCASCQERFDAGTKIEWQRGSASRHATCADTSAPQAPQAPQAAKKTPKTAPAPILSSGPQTPAGGNKRAGSCDACGSYLPVGVGQLMYCHEDGSCMRHFDHSGYHLYCRDEAACDARKAEIKKEKAARAKIANDSAIAARAAADACRAESLRLTASLASTECFDRANWTQVAFINKIEETTLTSVAHADGTLGYLRETYGYDNHRCSLYAPQEAVNRELDGYLATSPISLEAARAWLEKYSGCAGAEMYRRVVEVAEDAKNTPTV